MIPEFENLFQGFGADLPAFTRMVIRLSEFMRSQGWLVAVVIGGSVSGYLYMKKALQALARIQDRS